MCFFGLKQRSSYSDLYIKPYTLGRYNGEEEEKEIEGVGERTGKGI